MPVCPPALRVRPARLTTAVDIAEGLIWAALCAAVLKRYCAHMTQRIARVAMSTRTVAKCIRHVLVDILYDLMHRPELIQGSVERAVKYLSSNARRAHPKRDQKKGRTQTGTRTCLCWRLRTNL